MPLPEFLSIGMPAYHEEASIRKAINSILKNTLWRAMPPEKKELVVCVNGCKDGKPDATAKIVLEMQKNNPQIRCIVKEERGHMMAKNLLAREMSSRAELLFFFDSDVILRRNTIEKLYEALLTHPHIDLVGARVIPAEAFAAKTSRGYLAQRNVEDHQRAHERGFNLHKVSGCGYGIRTGVIKKIHLPENPIVAEDAYLSTLLGPQRTLRVNAARVIYRPARTFKDIRQQTIRYLTSDHNLARILPEKSKVKRKSPPTGRTFGEKVRAFFAYPQKRKLLELLLQANHSSAKLHAHSLLLLQKTGIRADAWKHTSSDKLGKGGKR